jgi:hypothetical protein
MLTAIAHPRVRAFQPEDAEAIVNRDGRQSSTWNVIRQSQRGPSFTAVVDDTPIACGGLMIPWEGVGMAWMILSDEAAWHWMWLSKTTKRTLRTLVRVHRLHRVEAMALEESPVNQRWLEWMGFGRERDGIARQYVVDRRSMVRYEWIGD